MTVVSVIPFSCRHIFEEAFGGSFAVYVVQPAALSHRVILSADGQQSTPSLSGCFFVVSLGLL